MTTPRAVLLEMEGVLVETRDLRRNAMVRALAEEGIAVDLVAYDDLAHGLPVRAAARALASAGDEAIDEIAIELVTLRAERHFAQSIGAGINLADGARDALGALHGVARLGLVTRASRREVEPILDAADASFLFECIVTGDDVAAAPKPSPESYHAAIRRLARRRAVGAGDVIALEDGRAGIRAARAAGLRCLAVGDLPPFRALDADGYLPTLRGATVDSLDAVGGHGHQ